MNKKGFTLIELLAVIIILGILMIIAIPSVTKYINDSRKSSYIDTAKELVSGARNLVNEGNLEMYDTDATYYIDISCLKTENGGKAVSPYGDFVKDKAYVVVTFDGKGYDYYWTSIDDSGQGVKKLIKYDNLDPDNIESDLKTDDIAIDRGIDGRSKIILIREANNCQKEGSIPASSQVNGATGEENNPIEYPEGKDKDTVVSGDLVKIGTEEFYVVSNDGTDLVLLAHYNLKVGDIYGNSINKIESYSSSDNGYGLQSSDSRGFLSATERNGVLSFSDSNYWNGKIGSDYTGNICTSSSSSNCAYVYDGNSNLYQYINSYKNMLKQKGANVKNARLLSIEETYSFCSTNMDKCTITSFWLGSAGSETYVWAYNSNGYYNNISYTTYSTYGVRPVIVI